MKRVFLVDAYALIYRYYFAFMGRPMRNRAGMNTSIVYGFTKFLRDIQRRERPDLLGVAFDPKGGTFRKEIYAEYKANRAAQPEDITESVPWVKRIVEAMCIPVLEVPGFEADDVIGTLAFAASREGYQVMMVTPDKDYGQLVGQNRWIYKQKSDGTLEVVGPSEIAAKYGFDDPALVCDMLALWGDASDNIPGVPGVGEKTACKLIHEWGGVERIIEAAPRIKGKVGENIAAHIDQLRLSRELAQIRLDVPIAFDPAALTVCEPMVEELRAIFTELDFHSFLADYSATAMQKPAVQKPVSMQGDLFSAPAEPEAVFAPAAEEFATMDTTPHTYTLIDSAEELRALTARLLGEKEVCFDTETTGLALTDRIVGLSLAVRPFEAWYIPWKEGYADLLRPLFEDPTIDKVAQNAKFDLMVLRGLGIEVKGRIYDTMLLHYLLDAEGRHGMDALARKYLNYAPQPIEELIGKGARAISMADVPVEKVARYAAEDADVTLRLKQVLWPQIERENLTGLYLEIEEPLIAVLADIECTGVKIDTGKLAAYAVELREKLLDLEARIRDMAADPTLNVNSPKQLGEVLFGRLALAQKPRKTATGNFVTDEEYLQNFAGAHPIVAAILEYRGVKKLLSTYVEALPALVNSRTGRIHTSFNQAVTATGRLSSTNPNLQNIPIRDELGRPIRAAFVPSDDDHVLVSADYSQVELRLMAHLSGDAALLEAFAKGEDIHTATAARLAGIAADAVTKEQRRRAKTANFGIIYGISAFGLSQRLDIPRSEASELIEGYFASYPGVKKYMEDVVARAREEGYVSTIFGRRRRLPDIASRNAPARALAERNAVNAPIQGSAADIMKLAMIRLARLFAQHGLRSKVILQVHDELVIDTLRTEEAMVKQLCVEAMEHAAQLKVRLEVECGAGPNWLEAH